MTTSSINVDLEVFVVDFYFVGRIDFWQHLNQRKASLAQIVAVKRTQTH